MQCFIRRLAAVLALIAITPSTGKAFTWKQVQKWAHNHRSSSSGGSSYSSGSYSGSAHQTEEEKAEAPAQHYCDMRANNLDHATSWAYAYGELKRGSGFLGLFGMSESKAKELLINNIVSTRKQECIPFIADFQVVAPHADAPQAREVVPLVATSRVSAPTPVFDVSAVFDKARAITVRIEGATQGSGVLVRHKGNTYTVLTAWHVVAGQQPDEELEIVMPDGEKHRVTKGSIVHLGDVDMAIMHFSSAMSYPVAKIYSDRSLKPGMPVYVYGYTSWMSPSRPAEARAESGILKASVDAPVADGYQLFYSNQTLPGMSGGPVLDDLGQLVGIHGRAEESSLVETRDGKAVATTTNKGVPISYYMNNPAAAR